MWNEIIVKSLITVIGFLITGTLGFFAGKVKNYKQKDDNQENALMCLLRSTITSKFFVYKEMGEIPFYEKQNVNYMHERYKKMGGNSYVDELVKEINDLPLRKIQ